MCCHISLNLRDQTQDFGKWLIKLCFRTTHLCNVRIKVVIVVTYWTDHNKYIQRVFYPLIYRNSSKLLNNLHRHSVSVFLLCIACSEDQKCARDSANSCRFPRAAIYDGTFLQIRTFLHFRHCWLEYRSSFRDLLKYYNISPPLYRYLL